MNSGKGENDSVTGTILVVLGGTLNVVGTGLVMVGTEIAGGVGAVFRTLGTIFGSK